MKRTLLALATGITTYCLTNNLTKRICKSAPTSTFEWISAEGEEESEPLPMFYIGDEVLIYDAYNGVFHSEEWKVSPDKFKIIEVKYDEEEDIFRYRLENGRPNDWYSEDWLSLPTTTTFIRNWEPSVTSKEPTEEMKEAERKLLHKAMDGEVKKWEIDRLLDVMNSGSSEESAKAYELLNKITGGARK